MTKLLAFNEIKAEAFADRLINVLNGGALTLMISLGHRSGLFDTLREMPAATSLEIAQAANLDERYVREWLGTMVTGNIVDYDSEEETYVLCPEHAAFLTRKGSPDNFAVVMQFIPMLGQVEDDILNCFHKGGGVPYEKFERFHDIMAEESDQTVVAGLLEYILPLKTGLVENLEKGIQVADIGCGSGRALNVMANRFSNSEFIGFDLSEEAIHNGQVQAQAKGLNNLSFEQQDVTHWHANETFDLITAFDAIHDQADPLAVLKNINRSLKPNGLFLMQDIHGSSHLEKNMENPIATFLYTISCMHCMTVSLAQGGEGLGTMWGEEQARDLLAEAGFGKVTVHRLPHDIQNSYYICKK